MSEKTGLSIVIGGAASGKSQFAERLVQATGRPKTYLATAQAFDDEMQNKIIKHQSIRDGSGWHTIEEPLNVAGCLGNISPDQIVLLDCATFWLSNHLLQGSSLTIECDRLLSALDTCPAPVVVVTNEVGHGIVPDNALSRQFRQAQGQLNQRLAATADLVVLVTAGLPMALKGQLP